MKNAMKNNMKSTLEMNESLTHIGVSMGQIYAQLQRTGWDHERQTSTYRSILIIEGHKIVDDDRQTGTGLPSMKKAMAETLRCCADRCPRVRTNRIKHELRWMADRLSM